MQKLILRALWVSALVAILSGSRIASAAPCGTTAPNINTGQYSNYRTNSNQQETILMPATVQSGFGYLFELSPGAGLIYAQPLILHNLTVSGTCYATVVALSTMRNQIILYDGDDASEPGPIWSSAAFGTATESGSISFPATYCKLNVGFKKAGILSTPVFDSSHQILYFVTLNDTERAAGCSEEGSSGWVYTLHTVSLRNDSTFGLDSIAPHDINGDLAPGGFLAGQQLQRPALLDETGSIFVGFGFGTSSEDGSETASTYQGWMAQYNSCPITSTTCPVSTCVSNNCGFFFAPTASAEPLAPLGAGVWMSGFGPASDGSFYAFSTGNGCRPIESTTPTNCAPVANNALADSILYRPVGANSNPGSSFTPEDSFETPGYDNYYVDDYNDLDISSGGVTMIPPVPPQALSSYLIASGKGGQTYLLQTSGLGGYTANPYQAFFSTMSYSPCSLPFPVSPQEPIYEGIVPDGVGCAEIHNPAYWNLGGGTGFYFVWGFGDVPRGYYFDGSQFEIDSTDAVPPISGTVTTTGGGALAISGSGTNKADALLWAVSSVGFSKVSNQFSNGALSAFRLYSGAKGYVIQGIYNSRAESGEYFKAQRYVSPLINNGKVYVSTVSGTNGQVFVYGPCSEGPGGECGMQPEQ